MKKGIRNADTVVYKLELALRRTTNEKLEVARKKRRKREEIVERRKIKGMATSRQKTRGRISLFNEEKENYKSDTKDETNSNQAGNNKNLI